MFLEKTQAGFTVCDGKVSYEFECSVCPELDGGEYTLEIIGEIPTPRLKDTDRLILPIDEGVAINVGKKIEEGEMDGSVTSSFIAREATVSMLAVERDGRFLLICIDNGIDAYYSVKNEGEGYKLRSWCNTEHKITYCICDSLPDACRKYKEIKGLSPITLEEKFKSLPEAEKLLGGIFWVFGDNYDEVMYADYDTDASPLAGDGIMHVAKELKDGGVNDAMFGIFFDGDSKYTKDLYEKYGYISTQYDNYDDVCPPSFIDIVPNNRIKNCGYTYRRLKDYPEGIRILQNGSMAPAWALKGYDGEMHKQSKLCPKVAAQRMKEEIPKIIEEYPYYKGRFIDVFGTNVTECFSDKHPVGKRECLEIKKEAFKFLGDIGLIAGTEDGTESVADHLVYTEGMHSPVIFRYKNSGRLHAQMYSRERMEHTKRYMLDPSCRVPLWQLLFHDCMLTFPYWGDSTASSHELIREKILYCCLFGCPPLYSFKICDFETEKTDILESYRRIYEVISKVGMLKMTDWQVLSDDYSLQKTVFGDRYEVIANFSDREVTYQDISIDAKDFCFKEI